MFAALFKSIVAKSISIPNLATKSEIIQLLLVPFTLSFYDALYNLADENEVRQIEIDLDNSKLKRTLRLRGVAMNSASYCEDLLEFAANEIDNEEKDVMNLAVKFRDLHERMLSDFEKAAAERCMGMAAQYFVRSHMLLAGGEGEGEGEQEQQQQQQQQQQLSNDLITTKSFLAIVGESLNKHFTTNISIRVKGALLDVLCKHFIKSIISARKISRRGVDQFRYDKIEVLELFVGIDCSNCVLLDECLKIFDFEHSEGQSLQRAVKGIVEGCEVDEFGDLVDDVALLAVNEILTAKRFEIISYSQFESLLGKHLQNSASSN